MNDTYFVLQVTLVNENTVTIGVFKNYPTANEVSHISQEWWHMELIEKFNLMDVLIATGKSVTDDDESTPVEFEIIEKKFGEPF